MQEKHFLELPVNVAVRVRVLQVIKILRSQATGEPGRYFYSQMNLKWGVSF